LRGTEDKLRTFTITRDKIPVHSVDVAYMIDEKTGYIKINRFSATTYEEFMKELEEMVENKGMKNLVIDVRQNPGGYLQQSTNILSQLFEEKNQLLVYTEGRTVNRSDYESTGRSFFDVKNITVLIDEGSASASEILAGAIQDHDRGTIIGRRSFGKGLVQEQYNLKDGAALRLTVARYYTPSGRSIQKAYDDLETYDHDVIDRYASGELLDENKIIIADSTEYYTSHGRVVYGGGGVKPDIFIPIDTTLMDDYYLELRQHIAPFVFKHLEKHRDDYKKYTLETFKRKFYVNNSLFNDFLEYAYAKDVEKNGTQLAKIQGEVKRFLKARIAKHLFDDEGFYNVWLEEDAIVQTALEVLKEDKPITELKH
jgi:carboxyl-terminal processing protease